MYQEMILRLQLNVLSFPGLFEWYGLSSQSIIYMHNLSILTSPIVNMFLHLSRFFAFFALTLFFSFFFFWKWDFGLLYNIRSVKQISINTGPPPFCEPLPSFCWLSKF